MIDTITIAHLRLINEDGNLEDTQWVRDGGGQRVSLVASCPEGASRRTFNVTSTNVDTFCSYFDEATSNRRSVGNPINYISREKHDLKFDFQGQGRLMLPRYYINQSQGWSFNDTFTLVDLYNISIGESVEVDFRNYNRVEFVDDTETESNFFDLVPTINTLPFEYVIPSEGERKVLIADQYGITQSFFGGPTEFRSSVDSSVLTYVPENNEVPASWKLVNSSGIQQFLNNSGDVTEIRYPNGDIIFYQYDENNRVVKKENKLGDYIAYEYDGHGNAVKATVMPENIVFDYIYETIETGTYPDRLVEVKQDQVTTLKYQYDDLDYPLAMTSVTDGNDITLAHWDYNANGEAIVTSPDNVDTFSLNYSQRVDGPVTIGGDDRLLGTGPEITTPSGSKTFHAIRRIAEYDRVVASVDRSIDGDVIQTQFFTYDSAGNLTSETDVNGDVIYKLYDTNRFLIEEGSGYRWNNEVARYGTLSNPLSSLIEFDANIIRHCWNAETGLRTRTITDDLVTTFVYSEFGQVVNTVEEPVNATNNVCN